MCGVERVKVILKKSLDLFDETRYERQESTKLSFVIYF